MLTKELLRFNRLRDGRITPRFIDVQNRSYLNLAEEMIGIYARGEGSSHEEIAEMVQPIIDASRSSLIGKGLNKLLLDRCLFKEPDGQAEDLRMSVFLEAVRHLASPTVGHLEAFREGVAGALGHTADSLTQTLFSDLPNRQTLSHFPSLKGEALLNRYNMALVQGLLLAATRMEVTIQENDVGRFRRFFRQIRFFRLLASIRQRGPGEYHLILDGPLSLFDQVRRYGFQFASLLPAVCHLRQWTLTADVRPKGGEEGTLTLDEGSGLVAQDAHTTAYIPPEFERFALKFAEENKDWTLLPDPHLLHLKGSDLIAVDFTFRHGDGQMVHLEMFHRWHKGPLLRRLQQFDTPGPVADLANLAIAVDRGLAKDPTLADALEKSHYFQEHGFLFNEFPLVRRAVACLEGFRTREK
ncbi:MAG: DUF790 family protein [Magnetococcales bacterium]|nr:DUF790 family protein [Magnetococcales bacterium]